MEKTLIEITLNEAIEPKELPKIIEKLRKRIDDYAYARLFIISGRMPLWLAGAIVHELHPAIGVALYDPRFKRGVVVASHSKSLSIGDLVEVDDVERVKIEV